jgi:hypothetical protein
MQARTLTATLGLAISIFAQTPAAAQVDLEFRAMTPLVNPGDSAVIGLYAVGQLGAPVETVGAFEIVFTWDPVHLTLLGVDASNPASLIFSGFPAAGTGGLNEANPPADGNALLVGLGPLGTPIIADEEGSLLAILNFQAGFSTPETLIELQVSGGAPVQDTVVFDGTTPNTIVTGSIAGTSVIVRCGPFDTAVPFGQLDLADVNVFASSFLSQSAPADLNEDGIFDLSDVNAFVAGFLSGCPLPP